MVNCVSREKGAFSTPSRDKSLGSLFLRGIAGNGVGRSIRGLSAGWCGAR